MIETRTVAYEHDGLALVGRLAMPDGEGAVAGVLIAHEGPGHDTIQLARADALAELGYAAFALDYHGDHAPFADRDAMVARLDRFRERPEAMQAIAQAGLDVLLAESRVDPTRLAAIGHCFGAAMVTELARGGVDLKAVAGFHPGLPTVRPEATANIVGRVRMYIGADDPLVPRAHRDDFEDQMRSAGVDWSIVLYGGVAHSFTHPWADKAGVPGLGYDERADHHSWADMLALLLDTIG